jgi:hypothetical protein
MLLLRGRKEADTMPLAIATKTYSGPERRRNCVFVTLNSEYHCRDGLCVAVVSRHTGQPDRNHPAIGRRLSGGLRFDHERLSATSPPESPHEGEQLSFTSDSRDDGDDVITSTLVRIERPHRDVLTLYPSRSPKSS